MPVPAPCPGAMYNSRSVCGIGYYTCRRQRAGPPRDRAGPVTRVPDEPGTASARTAARTTTETGSRGAGDAALCRQRGRGPAMNDSWDSLLRIARWGREQGKVNVIADLNPLCAIGDEIDHLRAVNAELEHAVRALLEIVDPIHGATIRMCLDALSRSAAEATASPSVGGPCSPSPGTPGMPVPRTS